MTDEPVIQIRDLRKCFGRHEVLKQVSFDIPRGQTLALLGRNGAGKTTIIRTLLGLLAPDSGTICVGGLSPQTDPIEVRRRTGFLAEDQQMFGWMTVDQQIRFVAAFHKTWDHALAQRYLTQFQLTPQKKVNHLSKGQSVRLGLLLALAHRPEVVILDDPALALDPIMRKEFNRDLIAHLQGGGCTVLYSSHLLAEVEAVADSVAILHNGRIVRQGMTEELRDEVKQLVFAAEDFPTVASRLKLLDVEVRNSEVSVVVDDAHSAQRILRQLEVFPRVVDLTLDDIFEAFVMGRMQYKLPTELQPVARR